MSQVDAIISDARSYASQTVADANTALSNAIAAINDAPTFFPTYYDYSPGTVSLASIPSLDDFHPSAYVNPVALPQSPSYLSFTPTNITMPVAPSVNYTINEVDRPVFDVAPFNGALPELPTIDLPADPELIVKAAPEVTEIDLGDLADVTPPTFNAQFNEVVPEFTDDLAAEYAGEYDKALPVIQNFVDNQMQAWASKYAPNYDANRAQLEAKIAEDMEDGRAMSEAFETALYNRARSRVERERERVETDLELGHSKRGFMLPPGSLMGGRNKLHQASADAIAQQATELAIERAKLEIQHKQFVMTLADGLHKHVQGMVMQYAQVLLGINQQALESAKQVAVVVARQYELLLSRYSEAVKVYATQASVYEVELKASLANVEVFKARAEAAKISAQVDATKLAAYEKELEFELAKVEIYKAKLAGVESKIAVGKQYIDGYAAQVQAYVAQVRGKESEFNAYSAAVRGEESRVKVEALKVDAYKAEVDAALGKVQIDKVQSDVINARNQAEAEVHKANVSAFSAAANAESSRISAESNVFRAKADGYRAKADVEVAKANVHTKGEELIIRAIEASWGVSSSENIAAGKIAVERAAAIARVGVAAGSTYASMAGSAMSSQNTMVSLAESV